KAENGSYGVYPVTSTNVLIDRVTVRGASDAGIYVGQSKNIVVQNSRAEYNVAGIEIENSFNADVHDNVSTHNAGGILVFDLPGLPQMGGHSTRVFHNEVVDNDTPNFAPKGNTVAGVPTGTGIMVMANRDVHVFDNHLDGNASSGVMLVAYLNTFTDSSYNPLPRDISVHGNRFGRNGNAPVWKGGAELATALGGTLPPVLWDGITSYPKPDGQVVAEAVHLSIADGPVVNLGLKLQGTPATKANPVVTKTLSDGSLAEPARDAPVDAALLVADDPAPTLESYHLFRDSGAREPNAALVPYTLNTPLFSDYALKFRYLLVPPRQSVSYREQGALDFPVGTTLVKTFAYPADFRAPDEKLRFIETRLLIHKPQCWVALTYVWNDAQNEAVLKRAGVRVPVSFIDASGAEQRID